MPKNSKAIRVRLVRSIARVALAAMVATTAQFTLLPGTAASAASSSSAPVFMSTGGQYVVANNATAGTKLGQIIATTSTDGASLTYSLESGDGFAVDPAGNLTTTSSFSAANGAKQRIVVAVSDGTYTSKATYFVIVASPAAVANHGLVLKKWTNLATDGNITVSSFTKLSSFPDSPQATTTASQVFIQSGTAPKSNIGYFYNGYVTPSVSGVYSFAIGSDDGSQVFIGTNGTDASLPSTPSMEISGWTGVAAWGDRSSGNRSSDMYLVAGQIYRIKVLYRAYVGSDHLELAWQGPTTGQLVDGSLANLIPAANFYPAGAFGDFDAPTAPGNLLVSSLDSNGVGLQWTAATDNVGVDHYVLKRNGEFLASIPAGSATTFTDSKHDSVQDYSVYAIDAAGNVSDAATISIDASSAASLLDLALQTGNANYLSGARPVLDELKATLDGQKTSRNALLNNLFSGISTLSWRPTAQDQYFSSNVPARLFNALNFTACGSNPCSTNFMLAGTSPTGSRLAVMGSNPLVDNVNSPGAGFTQMGKNLISWLITGDATNAQSSSWKIAILNDRASDLKNRLIANGAGTSSNIVSCTAANFATCVSGADLVIMGSNKTIESQAPSILATVKSLTAANVPILYDEDRAYYPGSATDVESVVSKYLGFSSAGHNYWTLSTGNYSDVPAAVAAAVAAPMNPALDKLFAHFAANDWVFDGSVNCENNSCKDGTPERKYLDSEFYPGARDFLKNQLNNLDSQNFDLFGPNTSDYKVLKLAVLLGDIYRRDIVYPVSPKNGIDANLFFRAMYADHTVYNSRDIDAAQRDLGNFSRQIPSSVAKITKSVSNESRPGDYFTPATVYALPGQTFKVTRTDSTDIQVKVCVNSLRSGSTWWVQDYTRPIYLQSQWVSVKPGETIRLTNPYGGPIQIWMSGSSTFKTTSMTFENVAQHPVWASPKDTAQFTAGLYQGDFSWAELATNGFVIHSRRDLMLEGLKHPYWNTPEALATELQNDFYVSNYNLAGFTGAGLSRSNTVSTMFSDLGWDCDSAQIHSIVSMNHFNSDQATCGYGCSGNPYDSFWAPSVTGWGDSHEMGHNIQTLHLNSVSGGGATGEVSNNVFPMHVVYAWNRNHPSMPETPSHVMEQDAIYEALNRFQSYPDPTQEAANEIWADGGNAMGEVLDAAGLQNQNMSKLAVYAQLAAQSKFNTKVAFGDNGWDWVTMMYMGYRLQSYYWNSDDATWNAHRDSLGMGNYTRAEARSMSNNDRYAITASRIAKLDERDYLAMWGIKISAAASAQIASYGYDAAARLFYYYPTQANGYDNFAEAPIGSVPVDGNIARKLPHRAMNLVSVAGDARVATVGTSVTLTAFTGAAGVVTFKANGRAIPECSNLPVSSAKVPDFDVNQFKATCTWYPDSAGDVTVSSSFTDTKGVDSVDSTWKVSVSSDSTAPVVSSISKSSALEGAKLTLSGSNLGSISSVSFNGVSVPVVVNGSGSLTLTVPVVDPSLLSGQFKVVNVNGQGAFSGGFTVEKSVTSVTMSAAQATVYLGRGEVMQLVASVAPDYATNKTLTWTSSNSTVAKVSDSGVVTAVATGNARITAVSADGTKSAVSNVIVQAGSKVRATRVTISQPASSVVIGKTVSLSASVWPAQSLNSAVTWKSSDSKLATVNNSGVVTGVASGRVQITATSVDTGATATVWLNVVVDVTMDDAANTLSGMTSAMSYSINGGLNWSSYDGVSTLTFTGNRRVLVGMTTSSKSPVYREFLFTANSGVSPSTNPLTGVVPGAIYLTGANPGSYALGPNDIAPSSIVSNGWGPLETDTSNAESIFGDGRQITINGVTYARGLGAHAASDIIYNLDGKYARFLADVGPDDEVSWSPQFTVKGDGVTLFTSGSVNKAKGPMRVNVSVVGVKKLELLIAAGGSHADWAGAHLTKAVSDVTVSDPALLLATGATKKLSASVTAAEGIDTSVTWSSSNTAVATVTSAGVVTGIAEGDAVITATAIDGSSATTNVSVRNARITELYFGKSSAVMVRGTTLSLPATVDAEVGADTKVTYLSSDPSVATVAANGTVTAVSAGVATISAVAAGGTFTASYALTVNATGNVPVTSVAIDSATVALHIGDTSQLTATVQPLLATNKAVSWKSDNQGMITVSPTGLVKAVANGTATVTVTTSDGKKTDSITFTVTTAVTGITVVQTAGDLKVGSTRLMKAAVAPWNASNKTVVWTSSDVSVATVDDTGLVTGQAGGTVTITGTTADGQFAGSTTLNVIVPVTGLSLESSNLDLNAGATVALRPVFAPLSPTNQVIRWKSNKTHVATVDSNGLVSGVTAGVATITGTTVDGGFTVSATVTVKLPVSSVALTETSAKLTVGGTKLFRAIVNPTNATNRSVTWSSSDSTVASVDSLGLVTAKATGTVTITATSADGSKSASATVSVVVPVTGISLTVTTAKIRVGSTYQLNPVVGPANATNKAVTYSSANTAIATVDASGLVTVTGVGKVTITVTTVDGRKNAWFVMNGIR